MEGKPLAPKSVISERSLGSARNPDWKRQETCSLILPLPKGILSTYWGPSTDRGMEAEPGKPSLDFIPNWRKLVLKASALSF